MDNPGRAAGAPPRRQGPLVGWLLVLALLPAFGWPWLSAWWAFPAPPPDVFRDAFVAEAADLRFVTAFDAAGGARTVAAGAVGAVAVGPCERGYRPDDRRRSGAHGVLPFAGGMADFTCIARLDVAGEGPLRAVVGLLLYTRPGSDAPPRANILPDGPYARAILARLSPGG